MGYLISAHITQEQPDVQRLAELPSSIGYLLYHHRAADVYMIDAFRASRPPEYPFQATVPVADIPLELPEELKKLDLVRKYLEELDQSEGFKRSYVNFGLLLSRLLEMPVFSFVADDDELDFACTVANNSLARLQCRCGDLLIGYEDGEVKIQPLKPEDEEEEEFLTDLDEMRAALPGVVIADRDTPWDTQLHAIASQEWQKFAQTEDLILGLGDFDPPEDEADWELLDAS